MEGFSKEPVCSEFTCLVPKVNVAKSRHFFLHVEFISEAGGRCLICDTVILQNTNIQNESKQGIPHYKYFHINLWEEMSDKLLFLRLFFPRIEYETLSCNVDINSTHRVI